MIRLFRRIVCAVKGHRWQDSRPIGNVKSRNGMRPAKIVPCARCRAVALRSVVR